MVKDVLQKYLKKLGVATFEDLNKEERETLFAWEEALRGRKITDDEVIAWIDNEKREIISKLTNMDLSSKADTFLKMELNFIVKLQTFLNGPNIEKAIMEKNIEKLM